MILVLLQEEKRMKEKRIVLKKLCLLIILTKMIISDKTQVHKVSCHCMTNLKINNDPMSNPVFYFIKKPPNATSASKITKATIRTAPKKHQ